MMLRDETVAERGELVGDELLEARCPARVRRDDEHPDSLVLGEQQLDRVERRPRDAHVEAVSLESRNESSS